MGKYQNGVGLMEVLVGLVLLAIAVLGFSALQLRGVYASVEAANNTQAMHLARDLAERIRANRSGYEALNKNNVYVEGKGECYSGFCEPKDFAKADFLQIRNKAENLGMKVALRDCQGVGTVSMKRRCIYVAWDKTTPTDGQAENDCTSGAAYNVGAKCIIMELYNYE